MLVEQQSKEERDDRHAHGISNRDGFFFTLERVAERGNVDAIEFDVSDQQL